MTEKIEKILLQVPKNTEVYVFGSILKSLKPNDLDILVIYDSNLYKNASIYVECEKMINFLTTTFNLYVHLTALSYLENQNENFIDEVNAIELKAFLENRLGK